MLKNKLISRLKVEPAVFLSLLSFVLAFTSVNSYAVVTSPEPPSQTAQKEDLMPGDASLNKTLKNRYSLFLHKRNFLLPVSYNTNPHNEIYSYLDPQKNSVDPFYKDVEAEFQISFFAPLVENVVFEDLDLMLAYTHHAWWQLYNSPWSKPFRETNYNPELYFRKLVASQSGSENQFLFFDLGVMHESNGQFDVLSRSWDRIFLRTNYSTEKFLIILSTWYRLPEKPHEDDNPNISKYYGYGEISAYYSFGRHTVDLKLPFSKSPGVEIGYSVPVKEFYRLYVNYKYGYGHSLIEYNKTVERIGIGIALEGGMDRRQ